MGLHVGGIHIESVEGLNQKNLSEFVTSYWLKLGAQVSKKDAKSFQPLSLAKTGNLGIAILPEVMDKSKKKWFVISDSERYTADHELAGAIAECFATNVWHWRITENSDAAYAKKCTKDQKQETTITDFNKALEQIESFPKSLVYYNQFNDSSAKDLEGIVFLSFENVPHRENGRYSGPSQDRLKSNERIILAKKIVEKKIVTPELLELGKDCTVYVDVINSEVEYADVSKAVDLEFVYRLAPLAIEQKKIEVSILEAALRKKDEDLFCEAREKIPGYKLYTLEQRGLELINSAEPESLLGFRIMETLVGSEYSEASVVNNVVFAMIPHYYDSGLPDSRIQEIIQFAEQVGPQNPVIFHNLACVYGRAKKVEPALDCIRNAVKYGYADLEKMRSDSDLDLIRKDPRFNDAFNS